MERAAIEGAAAELSYGLYIVMAVGAAGVYMACPRAAARLARAGGLLGVAALVLLLVELGRRFGSGGVVNAYFYIFAGVAVAGAARVITTPRPVYAALYLVVVVLAVAGLLVLMDAEFLAAALVIIYAGAIVVTYVFVIMLAQQGGVAAYDAQTREPGAAVAAGFLLTAAICGVIADRAWPAAGQPVVTESNTLAVGGELLSTYAVGLELAGVLLLVAIVGAIFLVRRPSETNGSGAEE